MELLTNLLEYSRIETGKMTLDAAPFEVFPLFDQTLGMFVPSAERKGVSLVSDNRAEKGMYVKADAARIRQVLINLLSNAVKFTDRGSVTLSAVVRSGDGNGAPLRLEFAVSDTGCGIAPEEQKRIFDEFSRADTAGKEGSGFGLAVVSRLGGRAAGRNVGARQSDRRGERFPGLDTRAVRLRFRNSEACPGRGSPSGHSSFDTRCRGRSLATSHVGRNTEIGRSQGLLL